MIDDDSDLFNLNLSRNNVKMSKICQVCMSQSFQLLLEEITRVLYLWILHDFP